MTGAVLPRGDVAKSLSLVALLSSKPNKTNAFLLPGARGVHRDSSKESLSQDNDLQIEAVLDYFAARSVFTLPFTLSLTLLLSSGCRVLWLCVLGVRLGLMYSPTFSSILAGFEDTADCCDIETARCRTVSWCFDTISFIF